MRCPGRRHEGTMEQNHKIDASVSVIMPVYNEEAIIATVATDYCRILESFTRPDCVLVNDGSTDRTLEVLKPVQARHSWLRVVTMERNSGYGATLMRAYREAKGDYIFQVDSDNQYLSSDFWKVWEERDRTDADLVIGYRDSRYGKDPFIRLIVTRLMRLLLWMVFRVSLRDANSSFRIWKRQSLERVLPFMPPAPRVPCALLVVAAARLRMRIGWVEARYLPRKTGASVVDSRWLLRFIFNATREIWQYRGRFPR
jgi:dolichol-phosphate mannosyltransferase